MYRILPILEKLGLIEKLPETPVKIRVTPVEEALSILIKRQRDLANQKVSQLTNEKDDILKIVKALGMRPKFKEEEERRFVLLSRREAIVNKVVTMAGSAEKEIDVITSEGEFVQLLPNFTELLERAIRKRVRLRLVLEVKKQEDSILKNIEEKTPYRASLGIKYSYQFLSHYILVDYKQLLMPTSHEAPLGERHYLWTCDDKCVRLMKQNFENIWHTSKNAKANQTSNSAPLKEQHFIVPSLLFFHNTGSFGWRSQVQANISAHTDK